MTGEMAVTAGIAAGVCVIGQFVISKLNGKLNGKAISVPIPTCAVENKVCERITSLEVKLEALGERFDLQFTHMAELIEGKKE